MFLPSIRSHPFIIPDCRFKKFSRTICRLLLLTLIPTSVLKQNYFNNKKIKKSTITKTTSAPSMFFILDFTRLKYGLNYPKTTGSHVPGDVFLLSACPPAPHCVSLFIRLLVRRSCLLPLISSASCPRSAGTCMLQPCAGVAGVSPTMLTRSKFIRLTALTIGLGRVAVVWTPRRLGRPPRHPSHTSTCPSSPRWGSSLFSFACPVSPSYPFTPAICLSSPATFYHSFQRCPLPLELSLPPLSLFFLLCCLILFFVSTPCLTSVTLLVFHLQSCLFFFSTIVDSTSPRPFPPTHHFFIGRRFCSSAPLLWNPLPPMSAPDPVKYDVLLAEGRNFPTEHNNTTSIT